MRIADFKYAINDIIVTKTGYSIKIISRYRAPYGKRMISHKMYKYLCLNCGTENNAVESSIKSGQGCPVCSPNPSKVIVGINDMWTTNPELAKMLVHVEDGYKYTQSSSAMVEWKCPVCGHISIKSIDKAKGKVINCKRCSDGISYPEKFMHSLLNQLNIDYVSQLSSKRLKWCNRYKYDFYIAKYNCIVEMQGAQHYIGGFERAGGKTIRQEKQNDHQKKILAKNNGIFNYITINCKYSTLKWIKQNILNSRLPTLFEFKKSDINWLQCHNFAVNSVVKKVSDLWNTGNYSTSTIGEKLHLTKNTVIKYLKQATEIGFCEYSPAKEMKISGINAGHSRRKPVICLTTGHIYESISCAQKSTGINNKSKACSKVGKTAGKCLWEYYKPYLMQK